jgi:hypothetical protein
MKIRKSFVANSSSSSFVCEICGASEIGYDGTPDGFVYCVNEHLMCEEHLLSDDKTECKHDCNSCDNPRCGDSVSEAACPICQFQLYSQPELKEYLVETRGIDPAVVFAEIKQINKRRKKLYNEEYITYVLRQFELTDDLILAELRSKFSTYKEFLYRNRSKNEN